MTEQMTPLRRRMIDDMAIRHMLPLTQGAYVRAVKNFFCSSAARARFGGNR